MDERHHTFIKAILRAVARLCVRFSISYQVASSLFEEALVQEAHDDLLHRGENSNVSRISVITGLTRRRVEGLLTQPESASPRYGLVQRVIWRWRSDKRFLNTGGSPRVLSCDFDDSDFAKLVAYESQDVHPGTVLFELERIKAIQRTRNGAKLLVRAYSPTGNIDEGMRLLSADVYDLARCVEENVFNAPDTPNLHGKTEYLDIPHAQLSVIREWFMREGSALHERMRNFVQKLRKERPRGTGIHTSVSARIALGTFSFTEETDEK